MISLIPTFAFADVSGLGATFPQPFINAVINDFQAQSNIAVRYKGLGSAEGIKRITAKTVDFAGTDIPLTDSELRNDDLIQIPLIAGGIVPVVNLSGVPANQLRLSGEVLADIYLGKLTKWNDARILELNPNLNLPNKSIVVVHREDGSGTSFTFTYYLSKVSLDWDQRFGIGSRILWPVGIGAKGNDGVAQMVAKTEGSIGYVEYRFAEKYQLSSVNLKNRSGNFVSPNLASFESAFATAEWNRANFYQILTDTNGEKNWPIVAVSYLLVHQKQDVNLEKDETLKFIDWMYKNGTHRAHQESYILINQEPVISQIKLSLRSLSGTKNNSINLKSK